MSGSPRVDRRRERAARGLARRGAKRAAAAVRQHDVELVHVVDRHAVDDRVAARRVVADHAAERRPVGGRRVGPEPEPVAARGAVEVLLHHAGATRARRASASISTIASMWRERSSTRPCPTAWPARLVPAAAREHRDVEAPGERDRGGDVVGVARERHDRAARSRTCSRRRRTGAACRRRRAPRRAARARAPWPVRRPGRPPRAWRSRRRLHLIGSPRRLPCPRLPESVQGQQVPSRRSPRSERLAGTAA